MSSRYPSREYPDYVLHKASGKIGYANLPDWLDFDEKPPRSFDVVWDDSLYFVTRTSTNATVRITKEVADLIRSLK